jgi:putative ABC transport system permease protein
VTAVFANSLGFPDALVPSGAAGGGHLGSSAFSQVLIGVSAGTRPADLTRHVAALSASYPGLQVASRNVVDAQYKQRTAQDSSINNLLLSVVGVLVSVALVNTLVVATLQRRKEIAMLLRVGATRRQLLAAATCQAGGLILIGVVLGLVAQTATVATVSEALTGSPVPSVPFIPMAVILGLVTLLTGVAILLPTIRMTMRHEHA